LSGNQAEIKTPESKMKRETPNAKRRAVSISPSSKNHMTATIRRGFALLIENGLTQGAIGRISYKIEVEGGTYKGVTARRESNDYGVMETKIDKYEFTASFVGEEANGVEVAAAEDAAVVSDEQVAEKDTLTVENAHTAYTVEDKTHPEYGFRLFNYQDQPMNDGKKPLSSIGTGSNGKVIFESEYHLYRIVHTRADVGLKDNQASKTEAAKVNFSTGKVAEESAPDYRDKEILITMHCPVKGHKVARLVSMNMFSIPDYNADEGWECNIITKDEDKRVELIKRWIDERANEQHESNLEFVKYEIVEEGVFAERDLNGQLRLEAEKHDCEERDVKVGDVVSSRTDVNRLGLRVETTCTVKHVFDNALQLEEYFEQDCITERSMYDAFKPFYNLELNFHCPLWHCIGGEKLWLSYDDKSKVYLITSYSDEINKDDVMNREKEFRKFSLIAKELGAKAFKEGETCKSDLDDDFNAMLDQVKFKGFNLSDHYFFGWSDEKVAFEARKKESLAADDTRKKSDEPKEVNAEVAAEAVLDIQGPEAELALESGMTIDNPDYSLLEANGVWGGEFRGQWKYKILHKSARFFNSSDKWLAIGHAVAAYNSIPIADRVGTKEEAYNKINKARYDRLDAIWGLSSMDELSGMMQKSKALSGSLFSSALKGMDARPFSVARNRSVRDRLKVGYVGETIADLAFYMEERAKIEAIVE
jgi:hypothetical protein